MLPTAPLGLKPRVNMAWPGRPPVPGTLHSDFVSKLGGDEEQADAELRAWYPIVSAHYEGRTIGEDDFTFWRARFREWVGHSGPVDATIRKLGPAYGAHQDWYSQCQHTPKCDTAPAHRLRAQLEAARGQR